MEFTHLSGKTVVVTGGSDGVGKAAVEAFVVAGANVVIIGRNEAKTAAAAHAIMTRTGRRAVTWEIADLSRRDSVIDVAARLRARLPCINVLVNNAGAIFLDRQMTADGFERTFALNHLHYFLLTLLLLDRLAAAAASGAPARVVCVSSRAHVNARLNLDDLQLEHGYSGWRAYANSKLCNILFTQALARRLDPSKCVVQAMHPGLVSTRFATNNGAIGRVLRRLMDVVSITSAAGADTLVWLADADDARVDSGSYWVKRKRTMPSTAARNHEYAERLWHQSTSLSTIDADALIMTARMSRP